MNLYKILQGGCYYTIPATAETIMKYKKIFALTKIHICGDKAFFF